MICVAEPPELYGPHVPTIVFQASDSSTCNSDNSDSLSGVLGKPESSMFLSKQDPLQKYYSIITVVQ
jgi:hypothetical protein